MFEEEEVERSRFLEKQDCSWTQQMQAEKLIIDGKTAAAASFTHLLAEDTDTLLGHRELLLKGIRADLRATKYTWVLNSFRMNVGIKY